MASGCPVITSDVSCLPETAGNAAVLCNPGNIKDLKIQIRKILDDEKFRNQLIERGRERAKKFHPKVYVEKLTNLYSKIATG
jgi:glycosyltransferase involved in cell wall biosynthesis